MEISLDEEALDALMKWRPFETRDVVSWDAQLRGNGRLRGANCSHRIAYTSGL